MLSTNEIYLCLAEPYIAVHLAYVTLDVACSTPGYPAACHRAGDMAPWRT